MWESQGSQNWPQGITLKEVMKKNLLITSPNKYLNLFVGGGFHEGMITQLYGEAGSGKTQTAMLFALGVSILLSVGNFQEPKSRLPRHRKVTSLWSVHLTGLQLHE
jgi:replication-associated recombination protein RarA